MSMISHLPESTTSLLGSPSVITSPVTLVKELLDNAIDAKASAVEILISPDTVSKIEVRDNGVGIHPNDYDSLGRRAHTSKLRTFEELRTHGSKTLGFRGEALASANNLAKVTIITKTSEDPVGATLHLISDTGGVAQQQKASVPVGTTVRIAELFGRLPVREQVAIKESSKTLDKIQELLKTYAMARPTIRLSFKVLQTPKQNWSYSPKRDAGIKEAVLQIVGNEIASHCIEKVVQFDGPTSDTKTSSHHQATSSTDSYTVEAYIMNPEADTCKVSKQHYFSVDGRPVSGKRGTMKKILDAYVKAIDTKFQGSSSTDRSRGYFIRLNISCPRGSYDVNVEPSKDEVLFADEQFLLDKFEGLWKEVYQTTQVSESNRSLDTNLASLRLGSHETVGAEGRTTHLSAPVVNVRVQDTSSPTSPVITDDRNLLGSVSRLDEETHPVPILQDCRRKKARPAKSILGILEESNDTGEVPMQGPNPRVVAKMNAPVHSHSNGIMSPVNQMASSPNQIFEPSFTLEPPILPHLRGPPTDLDLPPSRRFREMIGNLHGGAVPGGPYRSPMSSPIGSASQEGIDNRPAHPNMSFRRPQPPWTPPSSIQKPSGARPPMEENQQYCLEPSGSSDGLKQTRLSFNRRNASVRNHPAQHHEVQLDELPPRNHMGRKRRVNDDVEAMFSSARRQLIQQLSQPPPREDLPTANNRPREPRQPFSQLRSTDIQLNSLSSTKDKEPVKTSLQTGDPRAYLLRRQKSIEAEKTGGTRPRLRRAKSNLLPLENTPEDDQTHFLVLMLNCDTHQLFDFIKQVESYDMRMTECELEGGIDMDLDEGHRIEERLNALLSKQNEDVGGNGDNMGIDLSSLLKGKGLAVDV